MLTLADLVADSEFQKLAQNTVAIIPDTATLSEAKQAIDAIPTARMRLSRVMAARTIRCWVGSPTC